VARSLHPTDGSPAVKKPVVLQIRDVELRRWAMRKMVFLLIFVVLSAASYPVSALTGESQLRILTYPIGLVTGEQVFEVDLGPGGASADFFLDGTHECSVTAAEPRCAVDLGEAPHIHLLELIRRGPDGEVVARTGRWVNRPGQEAELAIQLSPRSSEGICGGKALWLHPAKKDPVVLEITENGRGLRIREDGRSFAFPCPDPDEPHVLAASAIFSDGRRAEAVALSGGFGGSAEAGLTAVALAAADTDIETCQRVISSFGDEVKAAGGAGFEVVFVLDPTAGYRTLMASGWHKGMMPTTTTGTKQFDTLVQQGAKGSDARAKSSWKRAESTLIGAEKMWFVLPDKDLQRANGFAQGKMNWLPLLFNFGSISLDHKPHLADAVAASGLVAAAGPRRRAVVAVLGNKADREGSAFTAEQAQNYLAEVGVPLYVMRNGKLREDGWPAGLPVKNMEAMADALEVVKNDLDRQCVAWFPGAMHPNQIAASLPEGVVIAGRQGEGLAAVELWRRAELESAGGDADVEAQDSVALSATGAPVARARVEITAVTVLVAAHDDNGDPVTDLAPEDLEVREDGSPVPVLGLAAVPLVAGTTTDESPSVATGAVTEMIAKPAQMPVSVYVNRALSGSNELSGAIEDLVERSDWLASLGPVDVVVADTDVSAVIEGATDPVEIRRVLLELSRQPGGQHAIEQIRTQFLRDIRKTPDRVTPEDMGLGGASEGDSASVMAAAAAPDDRKFERSVVLNAARSAIFQEDSLLRKSMVKVGDWALTWPTERPRVLFVVGAGFDEDPVDFYLPFIERMETQHAGSAREEFRRFGQAERVGRAGVDLAAAGWLVVPVAIRSVGSQTGAAEVGGGDRFQMFMSSQPDAIRTSYAQFLLLDPLGPQRHLAEPSGGEVVMGGEGLDRLMNSSAGWYRLSYQIDRPADGADHALEITTTRSNVDIRSTSHVASETLENEAAARVRRLLLGGGEMGELRVEIEVSGAERVADKQMSAEATITANLDTISPLLVEGGRRNLRVTVGVQPEGADPFILHRIESVEGVVAAWGYRVPLRWPQGAAHFSVVVEDLGTGLWGGAAHELQAE
jgi:hypothetical protein